MQKMFASVFLVLSITLELNGATEEEPRLPGQNRGLGEQIKPEQVAAAVASSSVHPSVRASTDFSGHLLVVPMDGSHWVGIKAIAQELGRCGHQVTVLIPEISIRMGPGKHYNTLTYPVPYSKDEFDGVMAIYSEVIWKSAKTFMNKINGRFSRIQKIIGFLHTTAESLLFNASLISHLQQQRFDAVLIDPMVPTGSLIARKMGLPIINLLRGMPCSLDMAATASPSPPSYVPRFFTGFTDHMTFKQRVVNTLVSLMEPGLCRLLYWHFDQIAHQFLGEDVGIARVLSDSDIWLLRYDFTLEFPRPLMPNMVLVGGINCHELNPLPKDLQSWVSGQHGFVVFTLGTRVSTLPEDITAVFIETFRRIPQNVIWRYTGPLPDNIPENVKIMKWVPQNDLLAHGGVRAFITHGGSHGLYEGLCHAVPMVMMPISDDQPDNAMRMASRGAGVVLDLTTITVEGLLEGLHDVINNARYKESLKKLSSYHKDRPIEPLDLSVYWTEYVMRNKGARHLRPAAHDLNWFQYHSLDVFVLLATVVLVVVMVTLKCTGLCLRRLTRKRKQD